MATERAYLSVEEVAGHFGVTTSTVYRLAQHGKLPAFKVGSQWRFSKELLEGWVMDRVSVERMKADERTESA